MSGSLIVSITEQQGSKPSRRPVPRDFLLAKLLCREWLDGADTDHARLLSIAARYWPELSDAAQEDLPPYVLDPLKRAAGLQRARLRRYCEDLVDHWRAERTGTSWTSAWNRDA